MTALVLVINSGSSSIKYQLVDPDGGSAVAAGLVERIGDDEVTGRVVHHGPAGTHTADVDVPDHVTGMRLVLGQFAEHGPELTEDTLAAVGHRVVQGGAVFAGPAVIDDDVVARIEELSPLAPLHNPANLDGIAAARRAFPDVPHVAVFDTSFHQSLESASFTYAIDAKLAAAHAIRRYGFHGTSHQYVSREAAAWLGRDLATTNTIVMHLGNGASVTAVRGGVSAETSMGMTPLEGLVMGTRSGDLDPAVLVHLSRVAGFSVDDLDELLNRRSGMHGLCGYTDMRDVHAAIAAGDEASRIAFDVYCHRLRGYIGSYLAHLGGRLDVLAFTAGVGENDPLTRAGAVAGLAPFGIVIDPDRNASARGPAVISPDGAPVTVVVFPTNEEAEIATQSISLVRAVS